MKKLLSLLALLALGICAQAQSTNYPTTTTPESGDNEVLTLKKQLRILNDARSGTTPLSTIATAAIPSSSMASSTALEASHVIKASAGTLISLVGFNNSGSAQYIQLHNAITLPANAAVPKYTFKVEAGANFSIDIPITGAPFSTGIVVCNSSTLATKTIGSADCFFTAVYR